jgi:hypothetical protein
MRASDLGWALTILLAAFQDPAPPAPKPAAKPAPVDEGLPPEAQIRREAASDPRNRKRDAFPVIRKPTYLPALQAPRMDGAEWVIGTVVGKQPLAFPVTVLNAHEIVVDER